MYHFCANHARTGLGGAQRAQILHVKKVLWVLGQQRRTTFHKASMHARGWVAHGARKFYRWKRSYSKTLRQLPPCLVQVLLVYFMTGTFHAYACWRDENEQGYIRILRSHLWRKTALQPLATMSSWIRGLSFFFGRASQAPQHCFKPDTKSNHSNIRQVHVGMVVDGASFDHTRAVRSHVLRKHKTRAVRYHILRKPKISFFGLWLYCSHTLQAEFLKMFGYCGKSGWTTKLPKASQDVTRPSPTKPLDNRMMQVWRVSRCWEILEKLEGVMGDYVERAAKRARRVALLTALMHLDRIGCRNSLGRFFWCAAVLTSLVAAPSDLSSCTARLLQVVPGQTFQCSCSLRACRSRSVGIWDMSFAMRRTAARQRLKHWKPRSRASQAQNSWPEQCFSGLRLTICKWHQKRKKTRQTHGTNWTQPSAIGHVALTFSKFSTSSGSGKPSSSNQRSASATLLNRLSATFRRPEFPSPCATSQQAWRDRSKLQLFALLTRKKRWPFWIRIPQTLSASPPNHAQEAWCCWSYKTSRPDTCVSEGTGSLSALPVLGSPFLSHKIS